MPMDFKDYGSLKAAAKIHKFRQPMEDELEEDYRQELSNHVMKVDKIEACEILFGVGWDKWTDQQKRLSLLRYL